MKKLLGLMFALFFGSGVSYGLSCAGFLSFDDLVQEAEIAFVGTVSNVNSYEDTSEDEYCAQMGNDIETGTFEFWFDIEDEITGNVGSTAILTREVTGINCTRGGACADMIEGETYVVVTQDGETLGGGLCSACPYMLLSEYDALMAPEPEICMCTMEYAPVCGVNGETYGNACGAGCAGVEVAYAGECQFGEPGGCERGYSGQVCGVDGITYEDACDAEDAGILKAYDGGCVTQVGPEILVDVPNVCTSWYDGCNECGVENGSLTYCTERACFTLNRAKCTAFDFMYLSSIHETIIDDVVGAWLETATQEMRNDVLAKIQAKIDDINYTLSVSSYMQGSAELRGIQFLLEVLWKIDSVL